MAVNFVPNIGSATEAKSCAANSCTASDTNNNVIEPIATRSSALPVYDNQVHQTEPRLGAANVKSFTLTGTGGRLTAVINTETAMPPIGSDPLQINASVPAPYGGVHAMVLFQTKWLDVDQVLGQGATGGDITWYGTTAGGAWQADTYRWFLYYGQVVNHRNQCGLGYYDPTGRLVAEAPIPFGQLFYVIGQDHEANSATCTLSNGNKTVTISTPNLYTWTNDFGLPTASPRSLRIAGNAPGCASGCDRVTNVSAFTWLDHEIGGPPPVGLILGWTWYTDAVPSSTYRLGIVAGDPNPAVIATERCTTNALGGLPADPLNRGWDTLGPCTIPNPVGTGFLPSGLAFTAI